MKFGELVKKYREEQGFSVRAFTEKTGLEMYEILQIEAGSLDVVCMDTIPRIASVFNVSPEVFLACEDIKETGVSHLGSKH